MGRLALVAALTCLIPIVPPVAATDVVELESLEASSGGGTSHVDWFGVFDDRGRVRRPGFARPGVRDAIFIEDRLSSPSQDDLSMLERTGDGPAGWTVLNGPVAAPHDLGNTYVLLRWTELGPVLDVRIERRVAGGGPSTVEIELNRDVVALSSGHRVPTDDPGPTGYDLRFPFRGERRVGDVRIRLGLENERVTSLAIDRLRQLDGATTFEVLEARDNLARDSCFGIDGLYRACGTALSLDGPGRRFVASGDPEVSYAPDAVIELHVDLGALVEIEAEFSTISVRTPSDAAIGSFGSFGRFAVDGAGR